MSTRKVSKLKMIIRAIIILGALFLVELGLFKGCQACGRYLDESSERDFDNKWHRIERSVHSDPYYKQW